MFLQIFKKITIYFCYLGMFIMLVAPISSFGTQMIETHNMDVILELAEPETLIISDISDTLYTSALTCSSKKWRSYMDNLAHLSIENNQLASHISEIYENILVNKIDKQLVYQNMPSIVELLQNREIPFLALTMKRWSAPYDVHFGMTTSSHLLKLNIDLEKSVSFLGKIKVDEDLTNSSSLPTLIKTDEYTFAKGIIFTNKNSVDHALNAFLNRLDKKPKKIVVLENSCVYQEALEKVLTAQKIDLIFVHHVSTNLEKDSFNQSVGTIQFLHYINQSEILSDEEALTCLQSDLSVDYETKLKDFFIEKSIEFSKEFYQ